MNNKVNAKEVLNDSTTDKEKKWTYLVFILMGIISFPIGVILGISLGSVIYLEGIWQLVLLPFLICSAFFAIGLYAFKERSLIYSLKAFTISFIASILIFPVGFLGSFSLGGVGLSPINSFFVLLIISAVGLAAYKKQPQVRYSLKAFVASFAGMFFILVLVFWPNSFLSLLVFFGPQQDASTSALISLDSRAENYTIYVPVLLDENKNVLKMYENPTITGSTMTSLIDTEHGKALKISKSGLGNYVFDWNEVPGKDTDRFVKWLENAGYTQPGEKLDITKTDNDTIITVLGSTTPSGRNNLIIRLNEENILKFYNIYDSLTDGSVESGNNLFNWSEVPGKDTKRFVSWIEGEGHVQPGEKLEISKTDNGRAITVSGRGTWIYRLNDKGDLEFHGVNNNVKQEIIGWPLFFAKEENGNLNIYSGNNKIDMNENHEKLKEDEKTSDEFFRQFTISMSDYTSAWVYSDAEIEKISFHYYLDPENRNNRIALSIGTDGWIHLKKGWQVVNLSREIMAWD